MTDKLTQLKEDYDFLVDSYNENADPEILDALDNLKIEIESQEALGQPSGLPLPYDAMYEGLTPKEAEDLYQSYKTDPNVSLKGSLGLPFYSGTEEEIDRTGVAPKKDPFFSEYVYTDPETEQRYVINPPPSDRKILDPTLVDDRGLSDVLGDTLLRNVPSNLLGLAGDLISLAGGDTVGKALIDASKKIPKVRAGEDIGDAVTIGITEFGTGAGAGKVALDFGTSVLKGIFKKKADDALKLSKQDKSELFSDNKKRQNVIQKTAEKTKNIAKDVAKFTVIETGGVAFLDPEIKDGLVIGEDSLINTDFDPFNAREEGITDSERRLRQKLNLVVDGYAASIATKGVLTPVVGGITWLGGLFTRMGKSGNLEDIEDAIVRDLLDEISSAFPESGAEAQTPLQIFEKIQKRLLESDSDVLKILNEDGSVQTELLLNTLQSMRMTEGLAESTIQQIRNLEDGIRGSAELQAGEGRQLSQLDETIESKRLELGGEEASREAAESIAGEAQRRIDVPLKSIDELETSKNNIEASIIDDLFEETVDGVEPTRLQKIIQIVKNEGILALRGTKIEKQKQTSANLFNKWVEMFDQKNKLFANVKGGSIADQEGVTSLIKALDAVENINPTLKGTPQLESQLQKLLNLRKPKDVPVIGKDGLPVQGQFREETQEEVVERLVEFFGESTGRRADDMDLGYFFREIRPQLAQMVDSILGPSGPIVKDAANPMRVFINYIDGEMDRLADSGDMLGDNAKEAMDYYKNVYKPFWGDGALEDLHNVYRQTAVVTKPSVEGREAFDLVDDLFDESDQVIGDQLPLGVGKIDPEAPETLIKRPIKLEEDTFRILNDIIRDPNRSLSFEQVTKILNQTESGAGDLHDIVYIDLLESLQTALKTSDADSNIIPSLLEQVRGYASVLGRDAPEKVKELDNLVSSLADRTKTSAQTTRAIDNLIEDAQTTREEVLNSVLGNFVKRNSKNLNVSPTDKPLAAFKKVFTAEDNKPLQDLIDLAKQSDDPRVLAGIQSEYLRTLRETIFNASGASGGKGPKPSLAGIQKSFDNPKGIISDDKLKILFSDNPDYAKNLTDFLSFIREELKGMQSARALSGRSDTAEAVARRSTVESLQALSTGVIISLGRLNRRAAIGQSIGTNIIRGRTDRIKPEVARVLGELLTDPKRFGEIMKAVRSKEYRREILSPRNIATVIMAAKRAEVYQSEESLSPDELLALSAQIDANLDKNNVDDQTEEVLNTQ